MRIDHREKIKDKKNFKYWSLGEIPWRLLFEQPNPKQWQAILQFLSCRSLFFQISWLHPEHSPQTFEKVFATPAINLELKSQNVIKIFIHHENKQN